MSQESTPEPNLPQQFKKLLTEYLTDNNAEDFSSYLCLSASFKELNQTIIEVITEQLGNENCEIKDKLIVSLAKHYHENNEIDELITFLNNHNTKLADKDLSKLDFVIEKLGKRSEELTGKLNELRWNNLTYIKLTIADCDQDTKLLMALDKLEVLIKKTQSEEIIDYLVGLAKDNKTNYPAQEKLEKLKLHFAKSRSTRKVFEKIKEAIKRVDS